jgi:hypothetical protein
VTPIAASVNRIAAFSAPDFSRAPRNRGLRVSGPCSDPAYGRESLVAVAAAMGLYEDFARSARRPERGTGFRCRCKTALGVVVSRCTLVTIPLPFQIRCRRVLGRDERRRSCTRAQVAEVDRIAVLLAARCNVAVGLTSPYPVWPRGTCGKAQASISRRAARVVAASRE